MVKCYRGRLKLRLTIIFLCEPHWLLQEEYKEDSYEPAPGGDPKTIEPRTA
jgi:hypothetical protein